MKTIFFLFAFIGVSALSSGLFAQDTDSTKASRYVITKNDGTEYIGFILSDDGREVLIETDALGKIYIPKADIKSMVKIEDESDVLYGEYRATGPFTTRYAFTTNALPVKKGENYALIHLYGPEVHFAVSNNLSVGLMTTWFVSPAALALKYSIKTKNEKVNLSIGSLIGTSGYLNNFRGYGGLHFANITFGDRDRNITFSGGYGYYKSGFYAWGPTKEEVIINNDPYYYGNYSYDSQSLRPATKGPIFSVAGIVKVGTKASFVFDSMVGIFSQNQYTINTTTISQPGIYPDTTPGVYQHTISETTRTSTALFVMPGMRFQSTDRKAVQVSMAGVSLFRGQGYTGYKKNSSFPFPMVSWFYKF